MPFQTDPKLKMICNLTGAKSAGWLIRAGVTWELSSHFGFNSNTHEKLMEWLANPQQAAWLGGALVNNRSRRRNTKEGSKVFGFERIYLFPNQEKQCLLLIGADELDREKKQLLGVIASYGPEKDQYGEFQLETDGTIQLPEIGVESPIDLDQVMERTINYIANEVSANAGFIAIRSGDAFVVKAVVGVIGPSPGREIFLEKSRLLKQLVDLRQGLIGDFNKQELYPLIGIGNDIDVNSWLAVPVIIGQRVIGLVVLYRLSALDFQESELNRVIWIVTRNAQLIENAIVFSEATRYLQQLALINELATAASSGSDIDEVADRVLSRLRRVFSNARVTLLVSSNEERWLREFGFSSSHNNGDAKRIPVDGSLEGFALSTEKPFYLSSPKDAPENLEIPADVGSELIVPLRYRGKVVGLLVLISSFNDAFSRQDEQLLIMVAGHLAGLIENVRLNDEMRRRAQNLNLIHEVVQKVIGLTDPSRIAQVAAAMMAEQFDYDFVEIFLLSDTENELILSGLAGELPIHSDIRTNYPTDIEVIGKVLTEGKSQIVEDLSTLQMPHPVTGNKSGAEICVLLQVGESPIGVVDALRRKPHSFGEIDKLALEALAGVLSSVLTNAHRYQELQMSVRQLEAARETGLEIAGDLDLDILLRRVVRRAREMIGVRGAELALVDEQAEIVRIVVSDNPWRDFTGTEIPFMSGVEGKVAVLGEPLVVGDYNNWSGRMYPERHMPYRTVAGIPLKLTGKVIGVLLVSDDRPDHEIKSSDLQLLEFFAAQAAVFIRNARLYQEIQDRMEAQRQAEMQLIRSARLAAVGEMAAGVAHELNNPLTTVAGFIELVLDELPDDAPHRQDLELVLRESRRARGVVRRLLDFSRPSDTVRVRTDINEVVSEVLTLVQHLVRTNGVELRVQLLDDLPWISVDPNQIKQVLLNLVHNALQAMPRGGILSVGTAHVFKDDAEWMTVVVEDNGAGIKPEYLERIFEPFFTTRQVGSGTGLGLSVSFGIINEHGGFIEVDSIPDEGSQFMVWLPVDKD